MTMGACSHVDPSCIPGTGTVTAGAISNASGTVVYSWKNASNVVVGTTASVSGLAPGTYTLTVHDNCTTLTCSQTINAATLACGSDGGTFPTSTTCADFNSGRAIPLTQICYTNGNNGKVKNSTPGVIFYFAHVTAPASSFCVEIVQTKSCSSLALLQVVQSGGNNPQVVLWDNSCSKYATGTEITYTSTLEVSKVCITGAVPGGTYTISVKYDLKSLVGSPNNPTGCDYTFFARTIVGNTVNNIAGSTAVMHAAPGCSAKTDEEGLGTADNTINSDPDFSVRAYPNPFGSQFHLAVESASDENIQVKVFDVLGQVIMDQTTLPFQNDVVLGGALSKGVYLVEVTQGDKMQVLRIVKSE